MDIYISGLAGKYPHTKKITKQVATDIPLSKVESYIQAVAKKFNLNPKAFVYGPAKEGISEEAAGVGVVKGGKDPRYMTATMGDDNDVTASTLGNMMQGYRLTGRKVPKKVKEHTVRRMAEIVKEMELVKSKIAKYKTIQETTSAGAIATSMGDGNGFGQSIFYKRSQPIKKAKKK